jgi:undecaprenyl-diphosphatase
MIEQVNHWDEQLLLFINQFHTGFLDSLIFQLTRTEPWIPLYLLLLYLIFRNYRKEGWLVLLGVAITILLADRITSGVMKPFFHRLRPSNEPALQAVLHTVNGYHGGLYGFASSHAANTAGVSLFIFLIFRNTYGWIGLIFIWPVITSYTRIYLGVHYPGDIIAGAAVGMMSGYAGYRLFLWLRDKLKLKNEKIKNGD